MFSKKKTWGFPYADTYYNPVLEKEVDVLFFRSWYVQVLVEKVKFVLLSWGLWLWAIPKKEVIARVGGAILCLWITSLPISWMLFYDTPFPKWIWGMKVILSLAVGLFVYLNDRIESGDFMDNSDSNY